MLPLRREITQQTQLQYNAMLVGAFQLLQAKQAEIEAGAQYIEAVRDYWIARAQVRQVESGRTSRFAESPASTSEVAQRRDAGGH
jgi:cobalt-zinc-cadmium efflux system outer membrane protein